MLLLYEKERSIYSADKEDLLETTQFIYGDELFKSSQNDLSVLNFNCLNNEIIEDIIVDILYEKMDFKGVIWHE